MSNASVSHVLPCLYLMINLQYWVFTIWTVHS